MQSQTSSQRMAGTSFKCPCFEESNEGLKKGRGQLKLSILARSPCFGESNEGLKKGRDQISGAHFNKVFAL